MTGHACCAPLKIELSGVPETLLIPLWARATETLRPDGLVRDPVAVRILRDLDYDFAAFRKGWKSQTGIAIRTWLLDREVARYLDRHPDGTVVILGCGLDARSLRLDNGRATWIDLDLPEVIALRETLIPQPGPRHRTLATSVTDHSWIGQVPGEVPPLFVAEGLFMYLPEAELRPLISALGRQFPRAEILIETLSRAWAGMSARHDLVAAMDAPFVWGVDTGRDLEAWDPALEFLDEWDYFAPRPKRWRALRWLRWIPMVRRSVRIMHLRFRPSA